MSTATSKCCPRCELDLPLTEFAKDSSKASGYKSLCKSCDRQKAKSYYLANVGAYKLRSHADVQTERSYLSALRGDPCAYCGEPGGVIDHIDPRSLGGKDEWENFIGACASCNSSKGTLAPLHFLARRQLDRELAPLLAERQKWIGAKSPEIKDIPGWLEGTGGVGVSREFVDSSTSAPLSVFSPRRA